jgi:uncharacterized protein
MAEEYALGRDISPYMAGRCSYATLVVTEQCNLRCRYCFQTGKNPGHRMSREVALRAIDFLFEMPYPNEGLVLEFTGGECTLEIDLLKVVVDYFKEQLRKRPGHPWGAAYRLMFATNGTLFHTEKFQRLLWENRGHAYVPITIDGTKRKHDRARVFPDGSGSYDVVSRNVKLWLRQFPWAGTKMTFSHDDLSYLCESVVHVWELGIKDVSANVVFEDVWQPGDPERLESELRRLADTAIAGGWWRTHRCSFFWEPLAEKGIRAKDDDENYCGTGKMVSIDSQGNLFPCYRFHDFSLCTRPARSIGSIYTGYDEDRIRSFYCLRKSLQCPAPCRQCEMKERCSSCTGHNYDAADSDTIFQSATFICEMHKARWRANQYYWDALEKACGVRIEGHDSGNPLCML